MNRIFLNAAIGFSSAVTASAGIVLMRDSTKVRVSQRELSTPVKMGIGLGMVAIAATALVGTIQSTLVEVPEMEQPLPIEEVVPEE